MLEQLSSAYQQRNSVDIQELYKSVTWQQAFCATAWTTPDSADICPTGLKPMQEEWG